MRYSFDLSVYFVADPSVCGERDICDVVKAALEGGVTMVQYRDKTSSPSQVWHNAERLKILLGEYNVPFLLNDHVDVVKEIGADGVHVGQGDMPVDAVRRFLGEDVIIGLTAFSEAHLLAVDPAVVDYVGTGPFYATKTKPDKAVLGAEAFANLVGRSPVPVVGIGGITAENAAEVICAGADGVAMMRAVSEAEDVERAARWFVQVVRDA